MPGISRNLLYGGLAILLLLLGAVFLNRCERGDTDPRSSPAAALKQGQV